MKNYDGSLKEFAKNHWVIDVDNKITSDHAINNDAETTIQARIIGTCEDVDEQDNPIGLTFMTTHALSEKSKYYDKNATYGWAIWRWFM